MPTKKGAALKETSVSLESFPAPSGGNARILSQYERQYNLVHWNPPKQAQSAASYAVENYNYFYGNIHNPNAALEEDDEIPANWMPNDKCLVCYECGAVFTMFRRKHHCRLCGHIVCGDCSKKNIDRRFIYPHTEYGYVRACDFCYTYFMEKNPDLLLSRGEGSAPAVNMESDDEMDMIIAHARSEAERVEREHSVGVAGLRSLISSSRMDSVHSEDSRDKAGAREVLRRSEHKRLKLAWALHQSQNYAKYLKSLESKVDFAKMEDRKGQELFKSPHISASTEKNHEVAAARVDVEDAESSSVQLETKLQDGSNEPEASISNDGAPSKLLGDDVLNHRRPSLGTVVVSAAASDGGQRSRQWVQQMKENSQADSSHSASKLRQRLPHLGTLAVYDLLEDAAVDSAMTPKAAALRDKNSLLTRNLAKYLLSQATQLSDDNKRQWLSVMCRLVSECVDAVSPDPNHSDFINVLEYVHVKVIPQDEPSASEVVHGVVFRKNVAHRTMMRPVKNPRILLLDTGIEYHRKHEFTRLQTYFQQQADYIDRLVMKIQELKPDIMLVSKNVCCRAQVHLLRDNVTQVLNVKRSVLRRLSRATGARIVDCVDHVDKIDPNKVVGTKCGSFRISHFGLEPVRTAQEEGACNSYLVFEDCPKDLGVTVVFRGCDSADTGKVLKRILHAGILYLHHQRRCESLFRASHGELRFIDSSGSGDVKSSELLHDTPKARPADDSNSNANDISSAQSTESEQLVTTTTGDAESFGRISGNDEHSSLEDILVKTREWYWCIRADEYDFTYSIVVMDTTRSVVQSQILQAEELSIGFYSPDDTTLSKWLANCCEIETTHTPQHQLRWQKPDDVGNTLHHGLSPEIRQASKNLTNPFSYHRTIVKGQNRIHVVVSDMTVSASTFRQTTSRNTATTSEDAKNTEIYMWLWSRVTQRQVTNPTKLDRMAMGLSLAKFFELMLDPANDFKQYVWFFAVPSSSFSSFDKTADVTTCPVVRFEVESVVLYDVVTCNLDAPVVPLKGSHKLFAEADLDELEKENMKLYNFCRRKLQTLKSAWEAKLLEYTQQEQRLRSRHASLDKLAVGGEADATDTTALVGPGASVSAPVSPLHGLPAADIDASSGLVEHESVQLPVAAPIDTTARSASNSTDGALTPVFVESATPVPAASSSIVGDSDGVSTQPNVQGDDISANSAELEGTGAATPEVPSSQQHAVTGDATAVEARGSESAIVTPAAYHVLHLSQLYSETMGQIVAAFETVCELIAGCRAQPDLLQLDVNSVWRRLYQAAVSLHLSLVSFTDTVEKHFMQSDSMAIHHQVSTKNISGVPSLTRDVFRTTSVDARSSKSTGSVSSRSLSTNDASTLPLDPLSVNDNYLSVAPTTLSQPRTSTNSESQPTPRASELSSSQPISSRPSTAPSTQAPKLSMPSLGQWLQAQVLATSDAKEKSMSDMILEANRLSRTRLPFGFGPVLKNGFPNLSNGVNGLFALIRGSDKVGKPARKRPETNGVIAYALLSYKFQQALAVRVDAMLGHSKSVSEMYAGKDDDILNSIEEKERSEFGADQPTKPEANASGNDAVAGNGSSEHGQPEQSSHDASSRGRRRSTHETPVESPKRGYLKSLTIHEHDAGFTPPEQLLVYDMTEKFKGSVRKAREEIESGRAQIHAKHGALVKSLRLTKQRGHDVWFSIRHRPAVSRRAAEMFKPGRSSLPHEAVLKLLMTSSVATEWTDDGTEATDRNSDRLGQSDHIESVFSDSSSGDTFFVTAYFAVQFAALRTLYLGSNDMHFINSLCTSVHWNATGGKSGATFLKTSDQKFIVKHISTTERDGFKVNGHYYFAHLAQCLQPRSDPTSGSESERQKDRNRSRSLSMAHTASSASSALANAFPTILVKILGMYTVTHENGTRSRTRSFIVMENLLYGKRGDLKTFDLKGTFGSKRLVGEDDEPDAAGDATKSAEQKSRKKGSKGSKKSSPTKAAGSASAPRSLNHADVDDDKIGDDNGELEKNDEEEEGATPDPSAAEVEKKNTVLLDNNFMQYTCGLPLALFPQAKTALTQAVRRDTQLLSNDCEKPVMDYSILVAIDPAKHEMSVGIIDYMRHYDLLKFIESHGKRMLQGSATVLHPEKYKERFLHRLDSYFMSSPSDSLTDALQEKETE